MGTIAVPNTFSANTTISSSQVNSNFTTIYNEFNGSIAAANLATDAVTTAKIAADAVTNAKLADASVLPEQLVAGAGTSWAWQSWVPTWTNLTVSGSTVTAKYVQTGKTVRFKIAVVLAGGNVPTGSVIFSLPVTSAAIVGSAGEVPIGNLTCLDASTAAYSGFIFHQTTTTAALKVFVASATHATNANVNATVPFTFGNTDEMLITGAYEAA